MKKRIYTSPQITIVNAEMETQLLVGSISGGGDYDIGWGGTDYDGDVDPEGKERGDYEWGTEYGSKYSWD